MARRQRFGVLSLSSSSCSNKSRGDWIQLIFVLMKYNKFVDNVPMEQFNNTNNGLMKVTCNFVLTP